MTDGANDGGAAIPATNPSGKSIAGTPTTLGADGGMSQPVTPPIIKKVTIRP